ncbi:MAG TPA: hypothetical protein VMK65_13515, partial [Longimicrobiales bacterium]|nr:hypothetical protein [Longimicrobiales bacterium]
MILLLGAVALAAALWGLSSDAARGGARAWAALLVAALPLIAIIGARGELERYRFSLLATRYRVQDERGVRPDTLVVSGNPQRADLLVAGAGERPLAVLAPEGDSALERVVARGRRDAAAVLLVEEERRFGRDVYHALGAVPLEEGDTIEVAGHRLAVISRADRLGRLPIPWARVHALERVGGAQPWLDDASATRAGARVAIPPAGGWRRYLVPRRPGILERSYPLADLLDQVAPEAAGTRPGLSSFVFHEDDGRLALALLDSEVRVGTRAPPPLPVWTRAHGGRRVLVAGLPHRDFPEPDLTLPER